MRKKIFLTGGSGFIGKNILEKLGSNYDFFAPSRRQLDLLNFESVNTFFNKNGPFDVVLHTAIVGGNRITGDSAEYALDSMRMFFNLASNEKRFKKFFCFGSGIEYGKEKPIRKFDETNFGKRVPKSNWGFYKYICAKYAEVSVDFINLRIFGAFGKYEDHRIRFISNSICKNILNLPIVINQNIRMDYLYVDDLIKIIDFFINNKNKFTAYNLTPGKSVDLITIAHIINSVSGKNVPIKTVRRGLSPEYTGNNRRLMKELGDFHFSKIEFAINDLYRWYFKNQKLIDRKAISNDYF